MPMPEMARYTRVDTLLECFDLSDQTRAGLMEAMPNAYGGEAPGEDAWPEPDHSRDNGYRLSDCWDNLADVCQAELAKALAD